MRTQKSAPLCTRSLRARRKLSIARFDSVVLTQLDLPRFGSLAYYRLVEIQTSPPFAIQSSDVEWCHTHETTFARPRFGFFIKEIASRRVDAKRVVRRELAHDLALRQIEVRTAVHSHFGDRNSDVRLGYADVEETSPARTDDISKEQPSIEFSRKLSIKPELWGDGAIPLHKVLTCAQESLLDAL